MNELDKAVVNRIPKAKTVVPVLPSEVDWVGTPLTKVVIVDTKVAELVSVMDKVIGDPDGVNTRPFVTKLSAMKFNVSVNSTILSVEIGIVKVPVSESAGLIVLIPEIAV